MRRLALLVAALTLAGCTDPDGARRALADAGFTDVKIGGYAAFMCGKDDLYATSFEAVNPLGRTVRGAVCGAPFKGSTVRF